jgi:hypothetical protein
MVASTGSTCSRWSGRWPRRRPWRPARPRPSSRCIRTATAPLSWWRTRRCAGATSSWTRAREPPRSVCSGSGCDDAAAQPPAGYGDGFRALGLLPPPWRAHGGRDGNGDGDGYGDADPACGIGDLLRNGMHTVSGGRAYAIEPLMDRYAVDVYLTGHEHNYSASFAALECTAAS